MDVNKILQGDCLELMRDIPDASVDMVLCDLPYGVTQNTWDSVISLEQLWPEYHRVTKDKAAIVLFGQGMFTAKLMASNSSEWRYNLVWVKDRVTGFLNANRMPLRNHEDVMVFYRELPIYNPQFSYGKPIHKRGNSPSKNNCYGEYKNADTLGTIAAGHRRERHPISVLYFNKPHPAIHPTEKPITLCEYLIKTYTNEGDMVLDNCIGSGTTAIACRNTGRNFIGIELNPEYVRLAEERLNHGSKTLDAFTGEA